MEAVLVNGGKIPASKTGILAVIKFMLQHENMLRF